MDLITSILDNAQETVKTDNKIIPLKIGNGFSEDTSTDESGSGEPTAEIIDPNNIDEIINVDEVVDGETIEGEEDFDILTPMEKKRNLLYANMYVILIDTGAGLMLQLASGNWTEGGDTKYTLSKPKRMELAEAWSEILNLEGHKKDPKSTLWMMFGSFYLPLIIMAVKERITTNRDKKTAKAQAAKETASKVINITPVEDKQQDILEVVEQLETVSETLEEEKKRVAAQVAHSNAITEAEEGDKKGVSVLNVINKTPVKKDVRLPPLIPADRIPEKETRGRGAGTKKNPKTGKFEPPIRKEGDYYFYSWGIKAKVKPPRIRKKK